MTFAMTGLCIYHLLNVYTDIKYRITKNMWHLLFFITGTILFFVTGNSVISYLSLVILSLLVGVILETFKISAAGDTKMCIVSCIWLGMMINQMAALIVLGLYVFYIGLFFIISYVALIRRKGLAWVLKDQLYNLKSLYSKTALTKEPAIKNFPGAVVIAIGSVLYFLFEFLM